MRSLLLADGAIAPRVLFEMVAVEPAFDQLGADDIGDQNQPQRYLSALLSARGACIEHLFAAYCFLLFMGHELMDGAASQSPLGGGCVGP